MVTSEGSVSGPFCLRQAPGVPQLRYRARQQAMEAARAFARDQQVDLWVCEGGTCGRQEAFRPLLLLPSKA
ncbi:MAG TPA: hypothetical protein VNE16_16110 [Vicinamibacterales bacterium]|nr:hypothetical protein [Vicinamibacterales bacterium]